MPFGSSPRNSRHLVVDSGVGRSGSGDGVDSASGGEGTGATSDAESLDIDMRGLFL